MTISITLLTPSEFKAWHKKASAPTKAWLKQSGFKADIGNHSIVPNSKGNIDTVIVIYDKASPLWALGGLPEQLPQGNYTLTVIGGKKELHTQLMLGWQLGCYAFTHYKKSNTTFPKLVCKKAYDKTYVKSLADSIYWARDLINTPANDMHPIELAKQASTWGKKAGGTVKTIKGESLIKQNYPAIYAVGKASTTHPHLVSIHFAKKNAKKLTLVGKGVCFDSGGLDIKPGSNMVMMKKDMGGAANILALAKMIIDTKINVELTVLLPIVENAIAGNAMRPSDVINSRKGLTIEVGNTDAEGRLILCDALAKAAESKQDLVIDMATLTGAARVALGADVPAYFTNDKKVAASLSQHAEKNEDPLWQLPLHTPYKRLIESPIADISNNPKSGFGGAISAALFLQEFIDLKTPWIHIDLMAWNLSTHPGRPQGGEAMGVRALHSMIKDRYGPGKT